LTTAAASNRVCKIISAPMRIPSSILTVNA
jgi:hypothetical protein